MNEMSGAKMLLQVESKKKSGFIAALLNLFLPGAGYIYCGRWGLGVIAFFFVLMVGIATAGIGAIFLMLMMIIDGYLCANRFNQNLITQVLNEN